MSDGVYREWAPGIGLTAIDLGYSMMDTVKQLHAHHFPVIFRVSVHVKDLQSKKNVFRRK